MENDVSGRIHLADNIEVLRALPSGSVDLIYIDPPFNTGKTQRRTQLRTVRSRAGDRVGFQGRRYKSTAIATKQFADVFDDYLAFLEPRLVEAHRVLASDGSLYFHVDYREVHYCKVLLDRIFGRASFLNEIIWAYDYGGRPKNRWPPKHDNILLYAKNPADYVFNVAEIERIPYMAPGLVDPEKAARGKLPTDTWWHTIVPTNSFEKSGYPTQKPLGILRRIIRASSRPGGLVLDFFAGSGTTGVAAREFGRRFILVDDNPEALAVIARRLSGVDGLQWIGFDPPTQPVRPEARPRAASVSRRKTERGDAPSLPSSRAASTNRGSRGATRRAT
jgi:site-specific DNA-methyltransferase (adenine-specific)